MKNRENRPLPKNAIQAGILVVLVIILGVLIVKNASATPLGYKPGAVFTPQPGQSVGVQTPTPSGGGDDPVTTDAPIIETPPPTPEPTPFKPYATEFTEPSNFIVYEDIMVDGEKVEEYVQDTEISFGEGSEYTDVVGVTTFRGDNFRNGGAYGTVALQSKTFAQNYWNQPTAGLVAPDGFASGGTMWTGQPLVATWPRELRQHMTNMHDWAKEQEELTEVISAAADGYIYFLELSTGKQTRNRLNLGFPFKGAGSLDPRGYPILYVGSGEASSAHGDSRAFVISLLDGSILYEFGVRDSFALRPWSMFDAAPLVDAETDKLIYPGENGILYVITLGTEFDAEAGTLSVSPSHVVKWRYETYNHKNKRWYLGMEASPTVWQGYCFMAENSGHLMCLDLNTMKLVWVQEILDDSNSTPILAIEDGHPYIYISTSFHYGWRSTTTAEVPIWKIDAVNGMGVWRRSYDCFSVDGVSGGVQGTGAVGENNLSDLVFYPVARTPNISAGLLVALNRDTGEEVWRTQTNTYSWSSPVLVYDENGDGYIIYSTFNNYIYILDGRTGQELDTMNLRSHIEATPVVYNNRVVIGTRTNGIFGLELK